MSTSDYQNTANLRRPILGQAIPKEQPALIDTEVHLKMMSELEKLRFEVDELRKLKPRAYSTEQWNVLVRDSVARVIDLEKLKAKDYATSADRLATIRGIARELDLSMMTVWAVLAGKHWRAIVAHTQGAQQNEPVASRVDDLLVYLLLYKAILQEEEPQP